eukprot:TRINITY_DN2714_c0_g1_i1.p1 TRINITY_DN2714_c0_g1~~TRINITY_DN2714_c0_g1_i1.p1  ORF type:complete len:219 (-),score=105.35 TRINITY_DN2714_c0_g1_i1:17-673(-)
MVKFEGLDTPKGVGELNKYLADRSYIEGYTPSSADVEVLAQVTSAPDASKAPHAARWYQHISSFAEEERKSWGSVAASTTTTTEAKESKDENDIDLFADDNDDEWEKEIQRRADENEAKKAAAGKKREQAKSAIVIDVKPWDDTTDLEAMEKGVRAIEMEGLEWKASKFVEIGYGIKKLQISCHVVDDLVSVDDIQEKIQEGLDELVQSTDVVTFTKL